MKNIIVTKQNKQLARKVLKQLATSERYPNYKTIIGSYFTNPALGYAIGFCLRAASAWTPDSLNSIADNINRNQDPHVDKCIFDPVDIDWMLDKQKEGELTDYAVKKQKGKGKKGGSRKPRPQPQPKPESKPERTPAEEEEVKVEAMSALSQAINMLHNMGEMGRAILTVLASKADSSEDIDYAKVEQMVRKYAQPKGIEIRTDSVEYSSEEYHHEKFEKILNRCVNNFDQYLWGVASGGKTTVYEQVHKALIAVLELDSDYPIYLESLKFHKSDLEGFKTADGTYTESNFYNWMKSGGLYCLDEMDRSEPEALIPLNMALDNGQYTFPNGETVIRHENARIITSGNVALNATGSRDYATAQQLDGATKDRFITEQFGIDANIESLMAGQYTKWLELVRKVRDAVAEFGISGLIVTARPVKNGAKLLSMGESVTDVLESTIYKGLDSEQVDKLNHHCQAEIVACAEAKQ